MTDALWHTFFWQVFAAIVLFVAALALFIAIWREERRR